MAELADAQDLGSCGAIHAGSTPVTRTKTVTVVDTIFGYGNCFLYPNYGLSKEFKTFRGVVSRVEAIIH